MSRLNDRLRVAGLLGLAMGAVALGACGGASAPAAAQAADGPVATPAMGRAPAGFQLVRIMDETSGPPMTAFTLQIPDTWSGAGGVRWDDSAPCFAGQWRAAWSARSADGASVFQILPNNAWQMAGTENPANPCDVATFRSARELLETAAAQARPHARVLGYADWTQQAAKMQQAADAQAGELQPGSALRVDAGHLLLGYAENGIEMREVLSAAVNFHTSTGHTLGTTLKFSSYRAPEARLDLRLIEHMAGSLEVDPQWTNVSNERLVRNVQRHLQARASGR